MLSRTFKSVHDCVAITHEGHDIVTKMTWPQNRNTGDSERAIYLLKIHADNTGQAQYAQCQMVTL